MKFYPPLRSMIQNSENGDLGQDCPVIETAREQPTLMVEFLFLVINILWIKIQGDSFDSSSGNRLLRAYFETSEGLKGIYVTLRLGANYFLVRNTLKWDLE